MAARLALVLLACIAAATPHAAELGTLFHTPEERARLDRLRRGEPPEPAETAAAREPRTPAVTGYVKRSDGRHTVWVDGTPLATRTDPRTFDPKGVLPREAPRPAPEAKPADPSKPGDTPKPTAPAADPGKRSDPPLPPPPTLPRSGKS